MKSVKSIERGYLGKWIVNKCFMGDLVEETDSILIQSHYMLKSHCILSVTYATNLFKENIFLHMTKNKTKMFLFSRKIINFELTAKKLEPNRGQTDNVSKTFCLAWVVESLETPSSQLDCTIFTH